MMAGEAPDDSGKYSRTMTKKSPTMIGEAPGDGGEIPDNNEGRGS